MISVRVLQLASSALPIGAFAYSRGLETAVELGWVHDCASAREWITGLLESQMAKLEAPVFARLFDAHAASDFRRALTWTQFFAATRETSELQAESEQLGRSLARLAVGLGLTSEEAIAPFSRSHIAAHAFVAHQLALERSDALLAYLYSWLEGTVTSAVKLVPLGQTDGQRMLLDLAPRLPEIERMALRIDDDDIGALLPGLALASALHETQHTRLFRS